MKNLKLLPTSLLDLLSRISKLPLSPINHSSIKHFGGGGEVCWIATGSASTPKHFMLCHFGKQEKAMSQQAVPQQPHFHPDWVVVIVKLSSGLLWPQTELAETISRKLHSKTTISSPTVLKKNQSPNNRRIQVEMKATQSGTVCFTFSLSWEGNANGNCDRKKKT